MDNRLGPPRRMHGGRQGQISPRAVRECPTGEGRIPDPERNVQARLGRTAVAAGEPGLLPAHRGTRPHADPAHRRSSREDAAGGGPRRLGSGLRARSRPAGRTRRLLHAATFCPGLPPAVHAPGGGARRPVRAPGARADGGAIPCGTPGDRSRTDGTRPGALGTHGDRGGRVAGRHAASQGRTPRAGVGDAARTRGTPRGPAGPAGGGTFSDRRAQHLGSRGYGCCTSSIWVTPRRW